MLKIKDEKWDLFCENAENLGFDKFDCLYYFGKVNPCFIFPKGSFEIYEPLVEGRDCLFINATCLGEQNEHEVMITYSNVKDERIIDIAKRPQLDKLYDLIKADMVEKVEE